MQKYRLSQVLRPVHKLVQSLVVHSTQLNKEIDLISISALLVLHWINQIIVAMCLFHLQTHCYATRCNALCQ